MFNEQEILKMPKWSKEYKRIYQQLYYRIKTEQITALEYDLFKKIKVLNNHI